MTKINTLPTDILLNKIKLSIYKIGIMEKYMAFDYLSIILASLIKNGSDAKNCYTNSVNMVSEKYHITPRAVTQGLNKVISMCNNEEIIKKSQFNIVNNSTLNKIRVIKNYVEKNLFT